MATPPPPDFALQQRIGYNPPPPTPPTPAGMPSGWGAAGSLIPTSPTPNPASGTSQFVNPWAQVPGLSDAMNFFQTFFAPDQALLGLQKDRINSNIAQVLANQGLETGYLNKDHQNQLARLGLSQQGLGIERGANQRAGVNIEELLRLAGLGVANQIQGINLNEKEAREGSQRATRQQISDSTAKGSLVTEGNRQGLQSIQDILANQLTGFEINRGAADIGYREKLVGLNEDKARVADRNKELDLRAAELGLDRKQLSTELERGLGRLGISTMVTVNDLMDKLTSTNIEERAIAEQILRQAMDNSDIFAANPGIFGPQIKPAVYDPGAKAKPSGGGGGPILFD